MRGFSTQLKHTGDKGNLIIRVVIWLFITVSAPDSELRIEPATRSIVGVYAPSKLDPDVNEKKFT